MSMGRRAYDILRSYVGREYERIQGVEEHHAVEELNKSLDALPQVKKREPIPPVDPKAHAREILGVPPEATFAEIQKAFKRLSSRSNPKNFPDGSVEASKAEEIHRKVHWAFNTLADGVDNTERRFRSLEID